MSFTPAHREPNTQPERQLAGPGQDMAASEQSHQPECPTVRVDGCLAQRSVGNNNNSVYASFDETGTAAEVDSSGGNLTADMEVELDAADTGAAQETGRDSGDISVSSRYIGRIVHFR